MDWLKAVLPTLATALGGPLAGGAVSFFADKLGLSEQTKDAVVAAIQGATPEQLAEYRRVDAELKQHYIDAGVKLEEVAAADRANARQREVSTGDVWTPRIGALIVLIGYGFVQWWLLTHVVAPEMREIVMRSLGTLDMALGLVLGYYYGSSSSSAHKNALLADGVKQ